MRLSLRGICLSFLLVSATLPPRGQAKPLELSVAEYEDRVHAAWLGQIIGTLMGFQFEGRVASSPLVWVGRFQRGRRIEGPLGQGKQEGGRGRRLVL